MVLLRVLVKSGVFSGSRKRTCQFQRILAKQSEKHHRWKRREKAKQGVFKKSRFFLKKIVNWWKKVFNKNLWLSSGPNFYFSEKKTGTHGASGVRRGQDLSWIRVRGARDGNRDCYLSQVPTPATRHPCRAFMHAGGEPTVPTNKQQLTRIEWTVKPWRIVIKIGSGAICFI